MNICENQNLSFTVIKNDTAHKDFTADRIYNLKDLIPSGHCFMMLHTLYPYMLTFKKGGHFSWERDMNKVIVCCPGVENRCCAQLIRRMSADKEIMGLEYKILDIEGLCPFYRKGQVKTVGDSGFGEIGWIIFNTLYLYSSRYAELNNVVVHCDTKEDLAMKIIG